MRKVIVESPYAGSTAEEIQANVQYARACMRDCLMRGEAPFASHLLYTQEGILDDKIPSERELGIKVGVLWGYSSDGSVVYIDRGISPGMMQGMKRAVRIVEFRRLGSKDVFYCQHQHDCAIFPEGVLLSLTCKLLLYRFETTYAKLWQFDETDPLDISMARQRLRTLSKRAPDWKWD